MGSVKFFRKHKIRREAWQSNLMEESMSANHLRRDRLHAVLTALVVTLAAVAFTCSQSKAEPDCSLGTCTPGPCVPEDPLYCGFDCFCQAVGEDLTGRCVRFGNEAG